MTRLRSFATVALVILATACDTAGSQWTLRDPARPDTVDRLEQALGRSRREGAAAARSRDSLAAVNVELLAQVNAMAGYLAEIDRDMRRLGGGTRLDVRLQGELDEGDAHIVDPEQLERRRVELAGRIERFLARLGELDRRWRGEARRSRALREALDSTRATLDLFRQLAESHEAELAVTRAALDSLREAASVAEARARALDAEVRRVGYVVGTREELLDLGVVVERGGARRFGVGATRGSTLLVRGGAPASAFSIVDRDETELPLPDPRGRYRILSAHDLRFTDASRGDDDSDEEFEGPTLRIRDPERFWEGARRLVILRLERRR
jgi:hypothetical protein